MEQGTQRPRIANVAREAGEHPGYRPNPVARMLTQRQTMTIGVLTGQALSVIFRADRR